MSKPRQIQTLTKISDQFFLLQKELKQVTSQANAAAEEAGERARNSTLRIMGFIILLLSILMFANLNHAVEYYFEKLEISKILDRAQPALARSEAIDRRTTEIEEELHILVTEHERRLAGIHKADANDSKNDGSQGVIWYGDVHWATLKSYNQGCRPPGNLISNSCFSAMHKFCEAEHSGRAGISQEVGLGVVSVACFK